jgi:AraC-like DNA-binding protein
MRYQEIRPNAAAARFVRCYWLLEDDEPESRVHRIVPDGRPELILNLGKPYESQTGETWKAQPGSFLFGQITGPLVLRSAGPARMIGIRFHPHTAGRLLKICMPELTDAAVSLDDISGRLDREVRDLGDPQWTLAERFDAVDRMVEALGRSAGEDDRMLAAAVRNLEGAGREAMGIEAVADRIGLSARQLERRFREATGIPPKLFSRMQRFQRVFPALENGDAGWADAALRCGYYDQAHLIRDFREFAGKPPGVLLAEDTDLARHFVERSRMSDFSKTEAGRSR